MMSDLKRTLKLAGYGYALKTSVATGVLFLILGIVMVCVHFDESILTGVLYILCGSLMYMQVLYNLLYCNMICASPRRKYLELTIPNGISAVAGVLNYIVVIISAFVHLQLAPTETEQYKRIILLAGVLIAALLTCFGAVYKYFVQSMLLFFVLFLGLFSGGMVILRDRNLSMSIYAVSGIGFVIVIVGILLSGLLRYALYKKPVSKLAAGAALRKALQ